MPGSRSSTATTICPGEGDSHAVLEEVEEFLTGVRHGAESERMLATVLFTDIAGSTERAAMLGDERWRRLLESHDELVRRRLTAFRGVEIKTLGDGFLATFDGPGRAIRCACAIREDVGELGVEVRAGVHTGECEVIGSDIGGTAVHIGARVIGRAAPGEVLVTGAVRDLVVGSGIEFADRGTHNLKGVPGEWQLLEVTATASSTAPFTASRSARDRRTHRPATSWPRSRPRASPGWKRCAASSATWRAGSGSF
jgi:class 3 adenylate cyclase